MSARGRALLTKREGVRTNAYLDSVGIWTIGIGHTSAAGPPNVTPDLVLTRAQVDEVFARDLVQYEEPLTAAIKVPVQQHEFDALCSWCFNIGVGAMRGSTVIKWLNAGKTRQEVADALMAWRKPPEIIGRRKSERAQFLTPYAVKDARTTAGGAAGGTVAGGTVGTVAKEAGASNGVAIGIGVAVTLAIIILTLVIVKRRNPS